MPQVQKGILTLEDHCIDCLSTHTEEIISLDGVPEHLVLSLFDSILAKGKLTPRLLHIFENTECDTLLLRIKMLGISDWTPPILPSDSRKGWLGQKPPF